MQAVAHFVETFVPEHYEVFLDLSRKTKTFSGRVVISRSSQGGQDLASPKGFDHRNSRSSRSSPSIYD